MSEQPGDADRRVVKKVVKKTVLRPVAPAVPRKAGAPVSRTGDETSAPPRQRTTRLTTPARVQASRAAAPVAPTAPAPVTSTPKPTEATAASAPEAPAAPVRRPAGAPASAPVEPVETKVAPVEAQPEASPSPTPAPVKTRQPKVKKDKTKRDKKDKAKKVKAPKVKKPRRRPNMPSISLPTLPKPDVRGRAASLVHIVVGAIRAFFRAIGHRIAASWRWLIGLRLPHLSPVRASAITGIIVGLLAVTMGWGFYQLFSATLGTQAGGGWGFLAFVFLSFVVFMVGELLLTGFGIEYSRIISILAVLLVLLLILVFFIELVAGIWAWPIVPVLCALMFMASSFTVITVSQEKNDQRLPWEPTDESQVNRE